MVALAAAFGVGLAVGIVVTAVGGFLFAVASEQHEQTVQAMRKSWGPS